MLDIYVVLENWILMWLQDKHLIYPRDFKNVIFFYRENKLYSFYYPIVMIKDLKKEKNYVVHIWITMVIMKLFCLNKYHKKWHGVGENNVKPFLLTAFADRKISGPSLLSTSGFWRLTE